MNTRAEAATWVSRVRKGESLASATLLPAVQALTYDTLRYYDALADEANQYLARPIPSKQAIIFALLLVGLCELRYHDTPPYAVVSEVVNAARALKHTWATGLLNAVLRKAVRQTQPTPTTPGAQWLHPVWFITAIQQAYPTQWEALLSANNAPPPLTLRINTTRCTQAEWISQLPDSLQAIPHPDLPNALRLIPPVPVTQIPGFFDGQCSVQDEAAQWVSYVCDLQPGLSVLDLCAAPGGKTAALLEAEPTLQVTAMDISAARLQRVTETLARLHLPSLTAHCVCDATHALPSLTLPTFDRILIDAPCSGTGVIRRHPDIKHLRRAEDIPLFAKTQRALLEAAWPYLKPGGRLVYATCSVLPAENEVVLNDFLAAHADVAAIPFTLPGAISRGPYAQFLPIPEQSDGFFYGVLTAHR